MAKFSDFLSAVGQARPVTEFLKTSQELEAGRQDIATKKLSSQILMNQESRVSRQFELEQKQRERKEDFMTTEVPIDDIFGGTNLPDGTPIKIDATPGQRKYIEQLANENKVVSEVGGVKTISIEGLGFMQELLGSKLEIGKTLADIGIQDTSNTINKLKQQLQSGELKGKDAEAASQQLKVAQQRRQGLIQSNLALDKEFQKASVLQKEKAKLGVEKQFKPPEIIQLQNQVDRLLEAGLPLTDPRIVDIRSRIDKITETTGVGGKQTALTANVEFLMENGLADTKQEAYRMARELGTKSKRQFLMEARLRLEGNQYLETEDIDIRMRKIEQWYNTLDEQPITATNPKTGEQMIYKDEKWQPYLK